MKKNILSISHNIIRELPEIQELEDLLDDASFKNVLNEAHEKNKSVLFSLLKEEVCQLINLSK